MAFRGLAEGQRGLCRAQPVTRTSSVLLDTSVTSTPVLATTVGENWVRRLLDGHPQLKTSYSRKYDYQRALHEDPEKISGWFVRVQKTIAEYGILNDDIYNFDETGFQMGIASTSKVVTRSDRRNRPIVVQPGNREWTTAIECINATGWSLDPMILLKGKCYILSQQAGTRMRRRERGAFRASHYHPSVGPIGMKRCAARWRYSGCSKSWLRAPASSRCSGKPERAE